LAAVMRFSREDNGAGRPAEGLIGRLLSPPNERENHGSDRAAGRSREEALKRKIDA
jgi:hypothetical protein